MCLYNAKKIEQEGEITCYKVLIQLICDYGEDFYRSPYQCNTTWKVGETKGTWTANEETIVNKHGNVSVGAYHTLKSMDDAVRYANRFGGKKYIAECVIPTDNRYVYEGEVDGFSDIGVIDGYASEKLRVVKVISLDEAMLD